MFQKEPTEAFRKECHFDWFTSGMHTSALRIIHTKSGKSINGTTQGSRFKLQKKLLKELWFRCQENENT